MNVTHFNTFASDGGAAKATVRLHLALLEAGCNSTLVVRSKSTDIPRVFSVKTRGTRLYWGIDARLHRVIKSPTVFFPDLLGTPTSSLDEHIKHAQVIHFHWIGSFLTSRQVRQLHQRTGSPVVWTLLDMAPLTGGCHYAWECTGYTASCGRCPQIRSTFGNDLSRWTWWQKHRNLDGLPITIVAPSNWIAERASKSSLFRSARVVRIPVPIDDKLFRPVDQVALRDKWQIPVDRKVIFLGATSLADERKGMRYLLEALNTLKAKLADSRPDLQVLLLVAGDPTTARGLDWPFPVRSLGYLADDVTLARAYQSADIFVCPSVEDAGPMMISESMMCGTPVVAFNSGGAPDLIETMCNGYLARYKDSSDLANGIYKLLLDSTSTALRVNAHMRATRLHAASVVAAQHMHLYDSLTHQ